MKDSRGEHWTGGEEKKGQGKFTLPFESGEKSLGERGEGEHQKREAKVSWHTRK